MHRTTRTVRAAVLFAAAVSATPALSSAANPEAYTLRYVETTTSGSLHFTGINDAGQFSGYTEHYTSSNGYTYHAVIGTDVDDNYDGAPDRVVAYATILGKAFTINDAGTIAGEGRVGTTYGAFYSPYNGGNFSVANKGFFDVTAIDNNGLLAGAAYTDGVRDRLLTYKPGDNNAHDFGRPYGSDQLSVTGINSSGVVIGRADHDPSRHPGGGTNYWSRAYYIDTTAGPIPGPNGGQTFDFHTLPAYTTEPDTDQFDEAFDINNNGLVVGHSGQTPVAWRTKPLPSKIPGGTAFEVHAVNLGTLSKEFPFNVGQANGVNDRNQVVGWSYSDEGRHGFLHTNGRMVDLNDLFTLPEYEVITEAVAINNRGQILAYINGSGPGEGYPVVLTPNYGASQEVPLLPSETLTAAGHTLERFTNVASGQWFDPDPAGSVKVVMESAGSTFTDILELPYGFGDMTVLAGDTVLGTFHAGDAVPLNGVTEFQVTFTGDPTFEELTAFPLKLAFNTDTASFRFETQSVPEPTTLAAIAGPALLTLASRRRRQP